MEAILSGIGHVLVVIFAFSVLIFVHELGHFLAALIVGVRPERFFIGFDIYGLGIKKEYKGCVYGIGLLPLGGYVKLAGQSDDPREQKAGKGQPWEFYAKPLWAQAFILVAGVAMNMVFGFLVLVFMYLHGMPNIPAVVGGVQENSTAYYAGLRSGDKILALDGHAISGFNKLREYVALNGKRGQTVFTATIERDGQTLTRTLTGQQNPAAAGLVMLGVEPPVTTRVGAIDLASPFAKFYKDKLRPGDEIIAIDGRPVTDTLLQGHLVEEAVAKSAGRTLTATIRRPVTATPGSGKDDKETIDVALPIAGVGAYDFGYSVAVGINEVMPGYPAAEAGLEAGDVVTAAVIDGKRHPLLTTAHLTELIRSRAYQPVKLTVIRNGEKTEATVQPACYSGLPEVAAEEDTFLGAVVENTPAGAKVTALLLQSRAAGILRPGDVITEVNGKPAGDDLGGAVAAACCREISLEIAGREKPVAVRPQITRHNGVPLAGIGIAPLPKVFKVTPGSPASKFLLPDDYVLQTVISPDGKTTVYWGRGKKAMKPVTFTTPADVQASLPGVRGNLAAVNFMVAQVSISESLPGAVKCAFFDSVDMSLTVYKMLHRLFAGDIQTKAMSGPLGIFRYMSATLSATDPVMELLKLLALISINLAVFNLLPFPVLDGGHVMFILIEWVTGRPVSDRVREGAQYFGVICLLALMVYVTVNDGSRWFKDWRTSSQVEYKDE